MSELVYNLKILFYNSFIVLGGVFFCYKRILHMIVMCSIAFICIPEPALFFVCGYNGFNLQLFKSDLAS